MTSKTVGELSQTEYEALPPAEHAAVTGLLLDIEAGRQSSGTSDLDLTPAQLVVERKAIAKGILAEKHPQVTPPAEPVYTHAIFATRPDGSIVRGLRFTEYGKAVDHWVSLDMQKGNGEFPHVKHFEVRSLDDPKYADAPEGAISFVPVLPRQRGYADEVYTPGRRTLTRTGEEKAARAAWKLYVPGTEQGRGGWFYHRNGQPAAQGLHDLARVCRTRKLIVTGADGRAYVTALAKAEA
jgi:hypothetical protein